MKTHGRKSPRAHSATSDFRVFLNGEFLRRKRTNPHYSLRAFARQLEVDQSQLSKLLLGKRRPTTALMKQIGARLGLTADEIATLAERASPTTKFDQMAEDSFNIISDWYHFAILELMKIENFQEDPGWIAQRLGISKQEVEMALDRLERTQFIERRSRSWRLLSPDNSWAAQELTTAARRNLQRNLAQKSLQAVETVEFNKRDHSSLTVACDSQLIPKIREKLTAFRRELDAFIQSHGQFDEVHQIVFAVFPISQSVKGVK